MHFVSKVSGVTLIVAPPAVFLAWYTQAATERQKLCLGDAASQMTKIFDGAGAQRYLHRYLFSLRSKKMLRSNIMERT